MTFRTRTFLSVFVASALALTVATLLIERSIDRTMREDIRQDLLTEARLAAALLEHQPAMTDPDAEADRVGTLIRARLTFVAADGRVIGDSEVAASALATLENHGSREEIIAARASGEGTAARRSATTGIETQYAAVAARSADVAFVRVALPLTAIEVRLAEVRRAALAGLGAGLLATMILTFVASALLHRRLQSVAETAQRYRQGDFTRPARDHGGDEIGTVAKALDETAHELGGRLRDMARERAHTDAILSGMVEGVVLLNEGGRLVLTNPAVRSMLRLPEPAEDRHYLEVVRHPDITAQIASALAGGRPARVEVQLDRDARRVFVAHVVPVARERGGGAVLVLHDITDLRHADQVRRDFVANVSHELRTPLTAIRGYVEALIDAPPEPERAREFLEIIARHAMRMERLVRDLLRLARLDAGQETLERVACSVVSLVSGVEREMESLLEVRRQRIDTDIAQDATHVAGDAAKLHDVLRNLIENASNYSPEGATIEVAARRTDGLIAITLADRGPGVPEADLPRIFERFYRVDRSRTRDPGGTGLGLSIVRHLVELHGGRVSAANRPGGGAVFTVRLPAAD